MNKLLSTVSTLAVASAALFSAAAMAQQPAAPAPQGDAKAGQGKVAMCIGCHGISGYQASFPEIHKVPMIGGQSAGYIASALSAYKAGERKHPTMRGIADSLTEQDILDISALYAAQAGSKSLPAKPSKEPSAKVAELLKKANCMSCHGENFAKPIDGNTPMLAGQHKDYLYVALKAYKTDNAGTIGRNNPVMKGFAKLYTNDELKLLANYIGSLDGNLQTLEQPRFR
jgi:cytochrome c553